MLKYKASPEAQTRINKSADGMYARRRLWRAAQREAAERLGIRDGADVVHVSVELRDVLAAVERRVSS